MRGMKKYAMIMMLAVAFMSSGCSGEKESTLETISEDTAEDTSKESKKRTESEEDSEEILEEPQTLCVYVCGQVVHPGVYELAGGSRIYQAVEAAGGLTENGDSIYVNQAEALADGQKVYIPSKEEAAGMSAEDRAIGSQSASGQTADTAGSKKVNLNTAGKEELMTLTGIGESKAEAILKYRQANGNFHSIEELMQVEGIKEGTYQKIKDQIEV